jgi:transposase
MDDPTLCCRASGGYGERCDPLVGLEGLHVTAVDRDDGRLVVTVESEPTVMGCPVCGVLARGHGRDEVELVEAPAFGRPVCLRWRKRRWVCPDPGCPVGSFTEQDEAVAAPRAKLTSRACRWAIEQIRREHASVNGVRRQLGTSWATVWTSIEPILAAAAADESRFEDVTSWAWTSTCVTTWARSRSKTAGAARRS